MRVGLKTLKEKIESQTALAVQERNELGALQRALDDQNVDLAIAEKINQSIGRL
jgi:hypothetical protein